MRTLLRSAVWTVLWLAMPPALGAFSLGIGGAVRNQVKELKKDLDARATATALAALPVATASASPTVSPTHSSSPSFTPTPSASPTATASPSASASPSSTLSRTPSPSATLSFSPSPSQSFTPTVSPSFSPSPTSTASGTPTLTPSPSSTSTDTPTATPSFTPGQLISSAAGTGSSGAGGDGVLAAGTALNGPYGVVVDGEGNAYFSDFFAGLVYKLDTAGMLHIVAGAGSGPDGGPAKQAGLVNPSGLALGPSGELYVAEHSAHRIRRIQGGIITTVAGNGSAGYSGDGFAATAATLNYPLGVAVDGAGDIYIADLHNNAVRRVSGGVIDTLLATPLPIGLHFGGDDRLYYSSNSTVYARDSGGGTVLIAGGNGYGDAGDEGPATAAQLGTVVGLWRDGAGRLYLADQSFHRVRMVDGAGKILSFAGNGTAAYAGDGSPAPQASLHSPSGLGGDAWGNLYIGDFGNHSLRKAGAYAVPSPTVTATFSHSPTFTPPSTGTETASPTESPTVTPSPSITPTWTPGKNIISRLSGLGSVWSVLSDGDGNLYYTHYNGHQVKKRDTAGVITVIAGSDGGFSGDGGLAVNARLNSPSGMAMGPDGSLYVADSYNYRIRRISPDGFISTVAGNGSSSTSGDGGLAINAGLGFPQNIAVDPDGRVYSLGCGGLRRIDTDGTISTVYATPYCSSGIFAASDGAVYFVADRYIRRRATDGTVSVIASNGSFGSSPEGLSVLQAPLGDAWGLARSPGGVFYASNYQQNTVWAFTEGGTVWRYAGSGSAGYSGDGGEARLSRLDGPRWLSLDGIGNLYIGDFGNGAIRMVQEGLVPTPTLTHTHSVTPTTTMTATRTVSPSFTVSPTVTPTLTATPTATVTPTLTPFLPLINHVAGNGGSSGTLGHFTCFDGNTNALGDILAFALNPSGGFYLSDSHSSALYQYFTPNICWHAGDPAYPAYNDGVQSHLTQLRAHHATVDPWGNVYVVDNTYKNIRRISEEGLYTNIYRHAGQTTGGTGDSGEGGLALDAFINPCVSGTCGGIDSDGGGSLYFVDLGNHKIKKITSTGYISTIVGNGSTTAFLGDGYLGTVTGFADLKPAVAVSPSLEVWFVDGCYIRKLRADGQIWTVGGNGSCVPSGDGGNALSAGMEPKSLDFDPDGNLYFADRFSRIRKIRASDNRISTVAGTGTSGYSGDGGIAVYADLSLDPFGYNPLVVDLAGNIYFWDEGNHRIRVVGAGSP